MEGLWEFPGGKKEEGESLEHCLEREIMEELGIKVQAEDLFLTVDHEYNTKKISLHVFNCAHISGKPKALQGQEIMWINPLELSELSFPPPDREIIRRLQFSDKNITQEE